MVKINTNVSMQQVCQSLTHFGNTGNVFLLMFSKCVTNVKGYCFSNESMYSIFYPKFYDLPTTRLPITFLWGDRYIIKDTLS